MSKVYLIISFLFLINSSYSQTGTTAVIYNVSATYGSIENDAEIKESNRPDLFFGLDAALKKMEYVLEFNNNNTHFYLKDILHDDERALRMARSFAGSEEFFTDLKKNVHVKKKSFAGELFFIQYPLNIDWKLLKEEKTISGYKCLKATCLKKVKVNDKVKKYTVIAWYCPQLPYSFGPKEFSGLPGLLLELQDDKVTFLAVKINLTSTNEPIDTLTGKEEIISQEQYDDIVYKKIHQDSFMSN